MPLFLRLIGAASISLCGAAIGWSLSRRAKLHRICLQQICQLMILLNEEIRYRKSDLHNVYQKIRTAQEYSVLALDESEAFQSLSVPKELNKEEASCFTECFSSLGTQSAQQECARLDYYLHRFTAYCDAAKEEEAQVCQLYTKLGIGAGIMAGLAVL